MTKAPDSKEKTIAAAVKLLSRQGYYGTALNEILDAAGSPRGSLYFHFPNGKEEIGVAAMARGAELVRALIVESAANSKNIGSFLERIVRAMASNLERSGYKEGCPIATAALETAAQAGNLAVASRTAFQMWETEIKLGMERFGMKPNEAERTATAVLSQLEGALLLARTYQNLEPLRRAEKAIKILAGLGAKK
ncbi:MAG: TetR/AcrR family transcriptional regulator [Rhodomicrobium sp.]